MVVKHKRNLIRIWYDADGRTGNPLNFSPRSRNVRNAALLSTLVRLVPGAGIRCSSVLLPEAPSFLTSPLLTPASASSGTPHLGEGTLWHPRIVSIIFHLFIHLLLQPGMAEVAVVGEAAVISINETITVWTNGNTASGHVTAVLTSDWLSGGLRGPDQQGGQLPLHRGLHRQPVRGLAAGGAQDQEEPLRLPRLQGPCLPLLHHAKRSENIWHNFQKIFVNN